MRGQEGVGESPDGDVRQVSVFAMSWGSDGAVAVENQRFERPSTTGEPRETNMPDRNHPRYNTHVPVERILPGSSVAGALDDRAATMVRVEWDHRQGFSN